jgi:hypothetical protein
VCRTELFVTVQEHAIAYCSCREAVKLFRFLLSVIMQILTTFHFNYQRWNEVRSVLLLPCHYCLNIYINVNVFRVSSV